MLKNMTCYVGLPKTGFKKFVAELFEIAPNWKLPKCLSIAEWIQCGIHSGLLYCVVMRVIYGYPQQHG